MELITNRTYDELKVGDTTSLSRTVTQDDIELFAAISGDVNPAHVDADFAKDDLFHGIVVHGMWGASLFSTLLGTELPGPGTIYLEQSLRFLHPIVPGDKVTATVAVLEKKEKGRVLLDCSLTNQDGVRAIAGIAEVLAPQEKISREKIPLPQVEIHNVGARLDALVDRARHLSPMRTAVVHPVDNLSIMGAIEAARQGFITPIFIGPQTRIRAVAAAQGIDLSPYEIVDAAHSDIAAETAVRLVHEGKAEALMKGALHTDELMRPVVDPVHGLRTNRRISHVSVTDAEHYPRLLLVTDAAINIAPDLEAKRDIAQNAIDLARALGIETPRIAILSAVEVVTPHIGSTLDAAALCKMAERGQITGGIVDGPLAFDNAVSKEAAQAKGIESPVAGQADILLVPDLESGNILFKQLEYLSNAQYAGIVLGARVPIILTSRAEGARGRAQSCAVALLAARAPKSA